jgi:pSer/pThr/pTyr-binding forkhead associated (FHA) protein
MPASLISLDYHVPRCDTTLADFPVVFGSGMDVQIRLADQSISPHHCEIDLTKGGLVVRDLGSVHGTFVNGTRIRESALLPGDELALGMLTFLVQECPGTTPSVPALPDREPSRRPCRAVAGAAT